MKKQRVAALAAIVLLALAQVNPALAQETEAAPEPTPASENPDPNPPAFGPFDIQTIGLILPSVHVFRETEGHEGVGELEPKPRRFEMAGQLLEAIESGWTKALTKDKRTVTFRHLSKPGMGCHHNELLETARKAHQLKASVPVPAGPESICRTPLPEGMDAVAVTQMTGLEGQGSRNLKHFFGRATAAFFTMGISSIAHKGPDAFDSRKGLMIEFALMDPRSRQAIAIARTRSSGDAVVKDLAKAVRKGAECILDLRGYDAERLDFEFRTTKSRERICRAFAPIEVGKEIASSNGDAR